jgi:cell division protein FtsI (penicillin-binding protein 3)
MSLSRFPLFRGRFLLLLGSLVCALTVLGLRLGHVMLLRPSVDETDLIRQRVQKARAPLVDRNGLLLATNVKTFSVYANPSRIQDHRQAAYKLCRLFPDLSPEQWIKRLRASKSFVWIARHVTPADREAVLGLGIPGIDLMEDQRRIWPYGPLFSHVLGFTNVDQKGLTGLEEGLDSSLQGHVQPIRLSLDARIQHMVRTELVKTIQLFDAKAGNALLLKIDTGEIIASVSWPDFNPHGPNKATQGQLFNRNTTGVYEFGSMLKIHNTAMLLDAGLATLSSVFDASSPLKVGRFRITDFKGKGRPLTVREAFLFSSNIAHAKMALLAGGERQQNFLKKLGFFDPVRVEMPEKALPLLPTRWRDTTTITVSYGYGLAVTPLHLAQSFLSLVNGFHKPLTFLHTTRPVQGRAVIQPRTAQIIQDLLYEATRNGQATKAAPQGYAVGAKTGTCNLRNAQGRYMEKQNLTSCIGMFPYPHPRYVLLVAVERPKPNHLTHGYATAGWIAAPLFGRIVSRAAPLLGVFPETAAAPALPPPSSVEGEPRLLLTIDRLLDRVH